jgi:hypothetical protein
VLAPPELPFLENTVVLRPKASAKTDHCAFPTTVGYFLPYILRRKLKSAQ